MICKFCIAFLHLHEFSLVWEKAMGSLTTELERGTTLNENVTVKTSSTHYHKSIIIVYTIVVIL